MFKESMRKSCAFAIVFFGVTMLFETANFYERLAEIYIPVDVQTAFFMNNSLYGEGSVFYNIMLVGFAVLTAVILFNFQWSKKQCNVIYSLGMTRTEIFFSRILGGIVPMAGSFVSLILIETVYNIIAGSTLNAHYWVLVLYWFVSFFSIYLLAFVLCSVVFCNTGNIIEGLVFTAILSVFTLVLSYFFKESRLAYTLGATFMAPARWNWSEPFFTDGLTNLLKYGSGGSTAIDHMMYIGDYFCDPPKFYLNIFTFSNYITALIYAVVLLILGYISFKRHKNEIAGSWGKAKLMTEITAAAVGFYAFTALLAIITETQVYGNGNFGTFFVCCAAFLAATVIFKLVFSSKRKAAIKENLNRFPAYAAVLGAVTLVFALGFFGYSGYVPKAEDIKSVKVGSMTAPGSDAMISGSSVYGLTNMHVFSIPYILNDEAFLTEYTAKDDISAVTKLHKAIIADGKIKNSAPDSCGAPFYIAYTLNNGKIVYRTYYESTLETARKMMALNDIKGSKDTFNAQLSSASSTFYSEDYLAKSIEEFIGRKVEIRNDMVVDQADGSDLGWIAYNDDSVIFYVYSDNEEYVLEQYSDYYRLTQKKLNYFRENDCFLFPTDMTKGYNMGKIDTELFKAIKDDLVNLSASQYYMHKAEDEIGILSFGLSYTERYYDNDYPAEYETTVIEGRTSGTYSVPADEGEEDDTVEVGQIAEKTSWNILSSDVKAVVVTKDMVNTVKYLESHGLMKYFTPSRKVSDIKAVKLAAPAELYGRTKLSEIYPVFYGAYWTAETVSMYNDRNYWNGEHLFAKVNNEITDVERMQKLLDGSVVFGYCGNDYRIMEISYNDGSIATVLVPNDVYKDVLG